MEANDEHLEELGEPSLGIAHEADEWKNIGTSQDKHWFSSPADEDQPYPFPSAAFGGVVLVGGAETYH